MAPPRERIVQLFCHGGSFNKEIWTPIVRRIQASPLLQRVPCEYVAIDYRYHGSKSDTTEPATLYYENGDKYLPRVEHPSRHWPEWGPVDLLETVKRLQREDAARNEITRVIGIGHSMGAMSLFSLEAQHPGTFAGLVLFEPPFAIDEEPETLKPAQSMMVARTLTRPEEWSTWADVVDHFKTAKTYRRWHPESLAAFLEGGITKTADGERFRLAMPLLQEAATYCFDILCLAHDDFARVKAPVVLEYGDQSQLFYLPPALELVQAHPHIYTLAEPLKGKTHLTVVEDPVLCADHIIKNLATFPVFQQALATTTTSLARPGGQLARSKM